MPTDKTKRLVIAGDSAIAEVAYEYFTHDSEYEVAAFAVNAAYRTRDDLFGVPVVEWETIAATHPPAEYEVFVALSYAQLNRLRARFYDEAKALGYRLASYVSPRAFVWRNVEIGDNCFIFENNVLQPFVKIGNNVTLWSGNHIGHHTRIRDHVFVASHVVISGFCDVGEYCFMGVNATVANNVTIAPNALIGAGASILRDTEEGKIYGSKGTPAHERKTAWEYYGVQPLAPAAAEPAPRQLTT
ncbi:MAG TPA: acetyltransferase [Gemmatimonadaceae bacterium]|nr:acetyltransferase [Gemmatimonadaceae bacterium]